MTTNPAQKTRQILGELARHSDYFEPYDRPDYDKLTKLTFKTAHHRAAVATRLLLDRHDDCRAFDNCFENGDAEEVIAILIDLAHENDSLRRALCHHWNGDEIIDGLPASLLEIWQTRRTPFLAFA